MFDVDTQREWGLLSTAWSRYRTWWSHYGWLINNPAALEKKKNTEAKRGHDFVVPPLDSNTVKPPTFPTSIPTEGVIRLATVIGFHRTLGHRVRNAVVNPPDNHRLRVELLLGIITEDRMRVSVQMADKAFRKHRAVLQINTMVDAAAVDIFRNYIASGVYETFFTEISALVDYANGAYMKVSKTYNNTIERIVPELS
jgi:hypothetical protein